MPILPGKRKLYVLVREDLPRGQQAVQGLHAAVDFQHEYPDIARKWYNTSNTVIMLGVKNRKELLKYSWEARELGLAQTGFWEPDIQEYTALALQPSVLSEELVSRLPLLLRKRRWLWRRRQNDTSRNARC